MECLKLGVQSRTRVSKFTYTLLLGVKTSRANLLSRVLLLLHVLGRVRGDEGPGVDDDLAVLEDDLPLHPGLDLPGGGDLLLLAGLPFL